MESIFFDPHFSLTLSFVGFLLFFGRSLKNYMAGVLGEHFARVSHPLEEAKHLLEKAESLFDESKKRNDDQEKQAEKILELARAESQEIFEKMKQSCEEETRAQNYSLDQQSIFLHHHWKKECLEAVNALLQANILHGLQKNFSQGSFSFLMYHVKVVSIRKEAFFVPDDPSSPRPEQRL